MNLASTTTLTRPSLTLSSGAATDPGRVRAVNEDSYLVTPGMVAVADGMGGHQAGDVASRICIAACDAASNKVPLQLTDVEAVIARANTDVREHARVQSKEGMGTTLVGAALVDNGGADSLIVFNIGDSRCYAIVDCGELIQLTNDHSMVQEMVERGEITAVEARTHPQRNVVTRAIGIEEHVAADFAVVPEGPRVRLLLCSDGVSGELDDDTLAGLLNTSAPPAEVARSIIDAVLGRAARDNATAVVLDIARTVSRGPEVENDAEVTGPPPTRPAISGNADGDTMDNPINTKTESTFLLIDEVPL